MPEGRAICAALHDLVLGVALGSLLGIAGCAQPDSAVATASAGQVTVAPGVLFSLPSPATLRRVVEAQQLISAHYRDQDFVFETRVRVGPSQMLVVGTDMLGRRAMTIEWNGRTIDVQAAPWVPAALRARNIIADIVLLHWPDSAVRAGLTQTAMLETPQRGQRVVMLNGRPVIRTEQTAGVPGSWSGRWRFRNLAWGYDLDIQSVEDTP